MTKSQFREILKEAFEAGFAAARQGTVLSAWEAADIRKDCDFYGLFERLEKLASPSPEQEKQP